MSSPWPMTSSPVADGDVANAGRWYMRLFKPINDEDKKLTADDTGWLTPTFQNAWVNFGSGWGVAAYRKRRGIVYLRGLVKTGTLAAIFTLPDGFQPNEQRIFTGFAGTGVARIDVTSAGLVSVIGYGYGGSNSFVSLAGIAFLAEN